MGVTNLKSANSWPVVNYRFIPPDLTQYFHNILINNPGGNLIFDVNTHVSGELNTMTGGAFSVSSGKTLNIHDE